MLIAAEIRIWKDLGKNVQIHYGNKLSRLMILNERVFFTWLYEGMIILTMFLTRMFLLASQG